MKRGLVSNASPSASCTDPQRIYITNLRSLEDLDAYEQANGDNIINIDSVASSLPPSFVTNGNHLICISSLELIHQTHDQWSQERAGRVISAL